MTASAWAGTTTTPTRPASTATCCRRGGTATCASSPRTSPSRLFLAHVRATTGTPVQDTNCHPFHHDSWLFVHNGAIDRYHEIRRELLLAVDPSLFDAIEGSTDSELMFALALTFGLTDDPLPALERMAGFVEETGRAHGIEHPLQMSLGLSDGERLYAVRYSSIGQSRTLFSSADAQTLRSLHPDNPDLQGLGPEDRAIVSEPLGDLPGVWIEVPEATAIVVQDGPDETLPFRPRYSSVSEAPGASVSTRVVGASSAT